MLSNEELIELANKIGGKVINLNSSSQTYINPLDMGKSEITDDYLDGKELEVREMLDSFDTIEGATSKEIAIEKLKNTSFLDGQPDVWKERAIKILNEYANK